MYSGAHAGDMFLLTCTSCSHRELRGYRGVVAVRHGSGTTELAFICNGCGQEAVVAAGPRRAAAPVVSAA